MPDECSDGKDWFMMDSYELHHDEELDIRLGVDELMALMDPKTLSPLDRQLDEAPDDALDRLLDIELELLHCPELDEDDDALAPDDADDAEDDRLADDDDAIDETDDALDENPLE